MEGKETHEEVGLLESMLVLVGCLIRRVWGRKRGRAEKAEKGDAAHIHGSTAVYGEGFMETMTRGQSLAPGRHLCPELG